jgi:hypothetical protein
MSTLSLDEAIGLLTDPPPPEPQAAAPAPAPEPEPQAAETAPDAPEAVEADAEPELEIEAQEEAEPLPVAGQPAPAHWSAEDAALWSQLPPQAQQVIVRQETQRQQQVQAVQQEAMRNQQALIDLARAVEERVPAIVDQYTARWREWTPEAWAALAQQDPTQYTQLKAQHDAERHQAITAQQARDNLAAMEQQAFLAQQSQLLAQVAPDLADPEKGAERITGVAQFLVQSGIPQDVLPRISAAEWGLAYDAMRYRQLASKAQARKATAAAPPRAVAPAARAAAPSTARTLQGLEAKLTKTGSIDAAVELLMARQAKR